MSDTEQSYTLSLYDIWDNLIDRKTCNEENLSMYIGGYLEKLKVEYNDGGITIGLVNTKPERE